MKLLDNQSRFTFIKNGQVKIDKTLLKYQELALIKTIKNNNIDLEGQDFPISSEDAYFQNVDAKLRELFTNLTQNSLTIYLKSENAKEFNEKFKDILNGEIQTNKNSLIVPDRNWDNIVYSDKSVKSSSIKNLFINISNAIKKTIQEKEELSNEKKELTVLDLFKTIHVLANREQEFIDRIAGYFSLLNNAIKMHQTAHIDDICQHIIINIYESVLAVNGYTKFISFDDLGKLNIEGGKLVDIDYIENFSRIIPQEVVTKKLQCDEFRVFDNYCVMYYDPTGATFKKPSAARRDPILFGLINHSEKLYYIADWEDELCDLTLEKVAEVINIQNIKLL